MTTSGTDILGPGVETDPYLATFERFEQSTSPAEPSWVLPRRKAGISHFAELGFPTIKQEDWRFTNVAPIASMPLRAAPQRGPVPPLKVIERLPFAGVAAHRLVFIDGWFSAELSSRAPEAPGVEIGSLADALAQNNPVMERHLAQHARSDANAFAALNTGFFQDGGFVHLPANTTLERPVHLLFISTLSETGAVAHPRNLIVAEKAARLTVLESYVTLAQSGTFTNAVTEIVAGPEAQIEHCKFQDESAEAFHLATIHAQIERSARFKLHSIALGGRLSRNNITTTLAGEGVECILNGLYLTGGEQLADHHMIVDHAAPRCNSHEYFNGILHGRSKGVFHGRILVQPGAQKTDAKQTNKNLLLSDDATINTKPQLEIYADDVKCTHGATIGQLNEEAIFYLRARGIDLAAAKRMLVLAFADEILDRIDAAPVREELETLIAQRLEHHHLAEEVR